MGLVPPGTAMVAADDETQAATCGVSESGERRIAWTRAGLAGRQKTLVLVLVGERRGEIESVCEGLVVGWRCRGPRGCDPVY